MTETSACRARGREEKRKAQLTLPAAVSFFFFSFFFFFCFFLFCFFKLRSRCLHAATGCWWFLGTAKHTLQPLCHRQARSCARYPISSRYFYSQILRSLVACLVMSAYTRSVNMRAHTCIQRACMQSRGGVVESVLRIATHVDKASASTVCKAFHVCDRVLYTCHRTDRWTPCRFHFHPYHWPYRRPSVGKGNVVGIGSLFFFRFFFLLFYRPSGFHRCGFFCAAFASRPPWRTSPLLCNKNNNRDNVSSAAFLCLRFFTFAFLHRDIVPFQRFLFLLYYPPARCLIRFVFIGCFVFKAVTSSRFAWLNVSMYTVCLKASAWMFDSMFV